MSIRLLAVLACFTVTACSPAALLERIAPPEVNDFAQTIIRDVQRGNVTELLPSLSSDLRAIEGVEEGLGSLVEHFAPGEIQEITLVGGNIHRTSATTSRLLTYQLRSSGGWSLVQLELTESGAKPLIEGIHVQRTEGPLEAVNAFTFRGKGLQHYLMLLSAIGVLGFSLFAAVRVALTPMPRRWLWALVALVGVGTIALNWTSGEMNMRVLNFQLFGVSLLREGLVGPWFLSVGFPLGAILALRKRNHVLNPAAGASSTVA